MAQASLKPRYLQAQDATFSLLLRKMRRGILSPLFEANHVDIVFAGHVHNYQRSFPLTFVPAPQPDGAAVGPRGEVAGEWKLDKTFQDGANAGPDGVIYIVSAAAGWAFTIPNSRPIRKLAKLYG